MSLIIEKKRELYGEIRKNKKLLSEAYEDNARYCEEQGWPSYGSNYELMCEQDSAFYGEYIDYLRDELLRIQGIEV